MKFFFISVIIACVLQHSAFARPIIGIDPVGFIITTPTAANSSMQTEMAPASTLSPYKIQHEEKYSSPFDAGSILLCVVIGVSIGSAIGSAIGYVVAKFGCRTNIPTSVTSSHEDNEAPKVKDLNAAGENSSPKDAEEAPNQADAQASEDANMISLVQKRAEVEDRVYVVPQNSSDESESILL